MTNEVTERKEKIKTIDCNVHGLILDITNTAFSLGRVKMECVDFFSRLTHQRLEIAAMAGGQTLGGSES